jgi:thioredoxin reductase
MSDVVIVGDGPGGLSAALFLAKNGKDVEVVGKDDTPMHKAMLFNYLGIDEITGTEFMERARAQVEKFGVEIHDDKVEGVSATDDGFAVMTADGNTFEGRYLILATSNKSLAKAAGVDLEAGVDRDSRTNVDGVYLIGWLVRPNRSQAIISAGDGAAAALDILSAEAGEDVHDFDVVS